MKAWKPLQNIWICSAAEVDSVATFYNLIFRKPVAGMLFYYAIVFHVM